jgi:hypothetical protein
VFALTFVSWFKRSVLREAQFVQGSFSLYQCARKFRRCIVKMRGYIATVQTYCVRVLWMRRSSAAVPSLQVCV